MKLRNTHLNDFCLCFEYGWIIFSLVFVHMQINFMIDSPSLNIFPLSPLGRTMRTRMGKMLEFILGSGNDNRPVIE